MKPGPKPGSEGAQRIAEAHRGSREHDQRCGFAIHPELAKTAGRKGGMKLKEIYGFGHFSAIGRKGGETIKYQRGSRYFASIGRLGGISRAAKFRS